MSKTSERLDNYIAQMQEQANQHNMILASDIVDILEQLKDDLSDDKDNLIKELEKEKYTYVTFRDNYAQGWNNGTANAIYIIKRGEIYESTENEEADTR